MLLSFGGHGQYLTIMIESQVFCGGMQVHDALQGCLGTCHGCHHRRCITTTTTPSVSTPPPPTPTTTTSN